MLTSRATRCFGARILLVVMCFSRCLQIGGSIACPDTKTHCSSGCSDRLVGDHERQMCRCDPQCALYGDCCVDFWTSCVNGSSESRVRPVLRSQYSQYFGCVSPIDVDSFYDSYVVVDRCPSDWTQDAVRDKCENVTLSRWEKFLTVFVSDPNDIVFKNVYCTVCHGIEDRNLRPWSLTLWNCKPAAGETQPVLSGGKPDYNTCSSFIMRPPQSMPHNPHRCYSNLIDSCAAGTTATSDQIRLCESQTSLLFHKHVDVVYKNVHCLNCSNSAYEIGDIKCSMRRASRSDPFHSFTLIFDFTGRMVRSVETTGPFREASTATRLSGNCSRWQVYDPFGQVCRDLSCPDGTRSESDGECMGAQTVSSMVALPTNLTEQCMENLIPLNSTSAHGKAAILDFGVVDSDDQSQGHYTFNIYTTFASADRIQISLDRLFSNITDLDDFADLTCNATTVVLVASSHSGGHVRRDCEGYAFSDVSLSDVSISEGVFFLNLSGVVYHQHEFIHETEYGFDVNSSVSVKTESVMLCSPFVGDRRCSQVTSAWADFKPLEDDDGVLVHIATGLLFPAEDLWLLPDGSVRVCRLDWLAVLADVSYAGSACSVVALMVTLVTYFIFPSLRNTPGKAVMNLMVAFLVAQVVMMIYTHWSSWVCVARGVSLHFFWLAAFFWMNALAFDLTYSLRFNVSPTRRARRDESNRRKLLKLCLYAWGVPAAIVASCFAVSTFGEGQPGWFRYGGSVCWIVHPHHSLLVFGAPICLIIVANCGMFAYMVYIVAANHRRLAAAQMAQNVRVTTQLCLKLGVVTGVTWTLFIVANFVADPVVWYISVIVNSLQGALIGLTFLLRANVRRLWRDKLAQLRVRCRCRCRRLVSKSVADVVTPPCCSDDLLGLPNVAVVLSLDEESPRRNVSSSCDTVSTTPSD